MPDPNLREWAGVIKAADYFIGCDSCGQHIARAVNQDASVFITGTHKVNISYPDVFHMIERDVPFYPSPMRICGMDSQLATRLNEPRVKFTEEEIETAYEYYDQEVESSKKILTKYSYDVDDDEESVVFLIHKSKVYNFNQIVSKLA